LARCFIAFSEDEKVLYGVIVNPLNDDYYLVRYIALYSMVRSFDFHGRIISPQSFSYQGVRYSSRIHTSKNERSLLKGTIMEKFLGNGVRWRMARPGAVRQELGPALPSDADSFYRQYLEAVYTEMQQTLELAYTQMRKRVLLRAGEGAALTLFERLLLYME
jgi:hypothetical protein